MIQGLVGKQGDPFQFIALPYIRAHNGDVVLKIHVSWVQIYPDRTDPRTLSRAETV